MVKAIKKLFNRSAPRSEAERFLKKMRIPYKKLSGGFLVVKELNIEMQGLAKLPDLSSVIVRGDFSCNHNRLTSLKGAPLSVGGNFLCRDNRLVSLEHAPAAVLGSFDCSSNRLEDLRHAPRYIRGKLECCGNPLRTLQNAPPSFAVLSTDFGVYYSLFDVPSPLRLLPGQRVLRLAATPDGDPDLRAQMLWALRTGETETALGAIRKGADVKTGNGAPLIIAAHRKYRSLALALLAAGADIGQALKTAEEGKTRHADCPYYNDNENDGDFAGFDNYGGFYGALNWLENNKFGLLEEVSGRRIGGLEKEKAALEKKVAALQEELDALHRPADIGKARLRAPGL